ncbi:MAG: hypothetical protein E6R03_03660, partial [Hyphomicrobiaceae bacterium]
ATMLPPKKQQLADVAGVIEKASANSKRLDEITEALIKLGHSRKDAAEKARKVYLDHANAEDAIRAIYAQT